MAGMPQQRGLGRVAVVGAGIAGLSCACALREQGVEVVVFDKGRSPGGRVASFRSPELDADLGAQYFTVRDERFARCVAAMERERVVRRWYGRVRAAPVTGRAFTMTPEVERYVGVPGMSAIARHLARDLAVRSSHRVDAIAVHARGITLAGTVGAPGVTLGPREKTDRTLIELGDFDAVLVCLPAEQATALVAPVSPSLAEAAGSVRFDPCLALAFATDGTDLEHLPFDGLFVGRDDDRDRAIAWIARDSSKPGRAGRESWVVHAAPEWSRAHLRDPAEVIERSLLDEMARLCGRPSIRVKTATLRRWAFARAPLALDVHRFFDASTRVGLGGDWCAGGRVEGAFVSGLALATSLLDA